MIDRDLQLSTRILVGFLDDVEILKNATSISGALLKVCGENLSFLDEASTKEEDLEAPEQIPLSKTVGDLQASLLAKMEEVLPRVVASRAEAAITNLKKSIDDYVAMLQQYALAKRAVSAGKPELDHEAVKLQTPPLTPEQLEEIRAPGTLEKRCQLLQRVQVLQKQFAPQTAEVR